MRGRKFISLFGCVAAAWSLQAPVDRPLPNLRLSDDPIDLMKDFSLSSAQAIGGIWETPPYIAPADTFDERYGQW